MATYTSLRASIDASFPTNDNKLITAAMARTAYNLMVDELGTLQVRGVATVAGNPGTLAGPAAFFASEVGTYTNYGGLIVAEDELRYLIFDGEGGWTSQLITDQLGGGDQLWTENGSDIYRNSLVGVGNVTTPANLLHLKSTTPTLRIEDDTNGVIGFIGNADDLNSGTAGWLGIRAENGMYLSGGGNAQHVLLNNVGGIQEKRYGAGNETGTLTYWAGWTTAGNVIEKSTSEMVALLNAEGGLDGSKWTEVSGDIWRDSKVAIGAAPVSNPYDFQVDGAATYRNADFTGTEDQTAALDIRDFTIEPLAGIKQAYGLYIDGALNVNSANQTVGGFKIDLTSDLTTAHLARGFEVYLDAATNMSTVVRNTNSTYTSIFEVSAGTTGSDKIQMAAPRSSYNSPGILYQDSTNTEGFAILHRNGKFCVVHNQTSVNMAAFNPGFIMDYEKFYLGKNANPSTVVLGTSAAVTLRGLDAVATNMALDVQDGSANSLFKVFNDGDIDLASSDVNVGFGSDLIFNATGDGDVEFYDSGSNLALRIGTFNGDIDWNQSNVYNGTAFKTAIKKTTTGNGLQIGSSTAADWNRIYMAHPAIIGGSTINGDAILELQSTTQALLLTRMTGAQAEAISTPADGLVTYINNGNGTTITSTGFWGVDGGSWVKLN